MSDQSRTVIFVSDLSCRALCRYQIVFVECVGHIESDSRCQMGEVSDRSIVGVRSDMQGQINVRSAM